MHICLKFFEYQQSIDFFYSRFPSKKRGWNFEENDTSIHELHHDLSTKRTDHLEVPLGLEKAHGIDLGEWSDDYLSTFVSEKKNYTCKKIIINEQKDKVTIECKTGINDCIEQANKLSKLCSDCKYDINIIPLPGASAVTSAISIRIP